MINIGKRLSIKDELSEYTKVKKEDITEHDIYIERIIVREDDEGENFGVIAGIDVSDNNNKVWFYVPKYDEAGICEATQDDIEGICNNGYIYVTEIHDSENGRDYFTGFIKKGDV